MKKKKKKLSEKLEVMYTSVETADLLGVSPRTVQLWANSGILQARKTSGGHRRFPESVLEEFLETFNTKNLSTDTYQPPTLTTRQKANVYRVLIAEDEPDLRTLYESTMEGWGLPLEIKAVKDGYEALVQLGILSPDLLIVDLNMPKMDGFHMINAIVALGDVINTDIMVITALTKGDIAARGGLPDTITVYHKPIPFDKLQQFIRAKISGQGHG